MKTDYKHGKFTLATTDVEGFTYDEYLDFCEANDIEPGSDTSGDFYEWCAEEANINWEDDLDNIEACKEYNIPVLITGHLGLWWGKPEIEPVREESVHSAIQKCLAAADTVTVEWEDGEIHVFAGHHDGCNCFTIRALSKKGQAKQYAPYKPEDTKRLPYLYAIGL